MSWCSVPQEGEMLRRVPRLDRGLFGVLRQPTEPVSTLSRRAEGLPRLPVPLLLGPRIRHAPPHAAGPPGAYTGAARSTVMRRMASSISGQPHASDGDRPTAACTWTLSRDRQLWPLSRPCTRQALASAS